MGLRIGLRALCFRCARHYGVGVLLVTGPSGQCLDGHCEDVRTVSVTEVLVALCNPLWKMVYWRRLQIFVEYLVAVRATKSGRAPCAAVRDETDLGARSAR